MISFAPRMGRRCLGFLLVLPLLVLAPAAPARAQTTIDQRVWSVVMLQGRAGPESPWRWSVELIARSRDGVDDLDVAAVRPIVSYALTEWSTVGGGYAFAPTFPSTGGTTREHRAFGQYIWAGPVSGGTLTWRTRVEARLIEGNSGPLGRLREQLRFSRPVKHGSKLALVGYDEIMLHLNDTTRSPRGIDQNRVFAGISATLTGKLRIELGYLNQFSPGHRGAADRMNHVLSGSAILSF